MHKLKPVTRALLGLGLIAGLCTQAPAATFEVSSTADAGPGSLRDAVAQANANPGADSITFVDGLGTITLLTPLVSTDELQILGGSSGQTLSGGNQTRILSVPNDGDSLALSDLRLTNGRTTTDGDPGNPCTASDGRGGALCSNAATFLTRITVENSTTLGAQAHGGGLYLASGASLDDSIVRNNTTQGDAANGGGVAADELMFVHNSLIQNNEAIAVNARGGGLYMPSGTDFEMRYSAVIANVSGGSAGGLRVSRTLMENSTVANNNAVVGGGMDLDVSINLGGDPGTPIIRNSTIVDNFDSDPVSTSGGGLRVLYFQTDYTARLESVLLAGNFGPSGNLNVVGVAGNPDLNTAEVTLDVLFSQIGNGAAVINGIDQNNLFDTSAQLLPLGDRGCAAMAGAPGTRLCVPVHEVQASSPALDAGSNPGNLEWDQRGEGFPRVVGGQADIGAFESGLSGAPTVPAVGVPVLDPQGLGLMILLMALIGLVVIGRAGRG
ncbi:right-handed parallel beta-helix repeat-containing protein [Wenzhouxiangella marina]|uniref:Uncharacterized protein n=1 Tax=Wenzhouxiangella marina TaxID=1579979 RepID=A0A0K0XZ32_9GAMM|nr:right-handed parallel beta-helix repeat-containing protein [Wenzhouxiangella marina]AKS42881.1 hypothetical protein WM2015_2523 [Wenzhouxiangella marina]MBB6087436.1 hypothetical protein [Wenzhouxiangella marina]